MSTPMPPRTQRPTRDQVVKVRLTPDEYAAASALASDEGEPLSNTIRRLVRLHTHGGHRSAK